MKRVWSRKKAAALGAKSRDGRKEGKRERERKERCDKEGARAVTVARKLHFLFASLSLSFLYRFLYNSAHLSVWNVRAVDV
jgi:hypothetical protein